MSITTIEQLDALPVDQAIRVTGAGSVQEWTKTADGWHRNGQTIASRFFSGAVTAGNVARADHPMISNGDVFSSNNGAYFRLFLSPEDVEGVQHIWQVIVAMRGGDPHRLYSISRSRLNRMESEAAAWQRQDRATLPWINFAESMAMNQITIQQERDTHAQNARLNYDDVQRNLHTIAEGGDMAALDTYLDRLGMPRQREQVYRVNVRLRIPLNSETLREGVLPEGVELPGSYVDSGWYGFDMPITGSGCACGTITTVQAREHLNWPETVDIRRITSYCPVHR